MERRRRGDDLNNSYLTALKPAFDQTVDLVLHGGDLFFRSRIHPTIIQAAFEHLLHIADLGIPVLIVPGNHERSNIPRTLLESHPGIIVFEQPQTHTLMLRGCRISLSGFANIRHQPRELFKEQLEKTGWQNGEADVRLLCLHQAVEGAQVGVQNYTFRTGDDVIRGGDIPNGFHAVLSGHIHRHQVLTKDLSGRPLHAPVFYPGSTERISFAEREEEKGYLILTIHPNGDERISYQFFPLPTRPMIDLVVTCRGFSLDQTKEWLITKIAALDKNAVVRVHTDESDAGVWRSALNDRWLRSVAPKSMNISRSHWRRYGQSAP